MSEVDDALAKSRELQQWYKDTYGSPDNAVSEPSDANSNGFRPSRDATAMEKLIWSNRYDVPVRTAEPPVTLEEIGMSRADFARLRPQRRLELSNEAMARRAKR